MASTFIIFNNRTKNKLDLKLSGDFDGSSACELINTLKENSKKVAKIIVHTNSLSSLHPFGLEVFYKKWLFLKNEPLNITFTGKHWEAIAVR